MFGGNEIKDLDLKNSCILHDHRYHYSYAISKQFLIDNTRKLKSLTIFSLSDNFELEIDGDCYSLNKNDYLNIENCDVNPLNENFKCLISGSQLKCSEQKCVKPNNLETAKMVSKPWGSEYWLTGASGKYSFKHIILKKGFKTSLQYHIEKEETNLLLGGKALFHYKSNDSVSNDNTKTEDISHTGFIENNYIHVIPQTIHRIEAIESLLLYETSTPQLDDVIRIQDDNNRKHGKINSEHQ